MPVFRGFEEALKILKKLGTKQRSILLENIEKMDGEMAGKLQKELHTLEDLQYLTTIMLVNFLKDIDLPLVGMALRKVSPSVSEKILSNVSTGIKLEIEDGLKGAPVSADKVQQAYDKVMEHFNKKLEAGSIIIDRDEKMV